MCGDNVVSMSSKSRAPRKYAVRAVVFQEGEWLCAQCLEYDLMVQAKNLHSPAGSMALANHPVAWVACRATVVRPQPHLVGPRDRP